MQDENYRPPEADVVKPAIGAIVGLINVLFIFTEGKRCGHDYIAGTIVIDDMAPENLPGPRR